MKALLLTPIPILLSGCHFGDADIHEHAYSIYRGTVHDLATNATLSTFCARWDVPHVDRIVFNAPPGAHVELEVLMEKRRETYKQGVAPDRDEAFWCDPSREVSDQPVAYWRCLHEVGADPAAVVTRAEPRGLVGINDVSSGYALELDVKHAGILMVAIDKQCAGKPDAAPSDPIPEATIQ